jgi:hypothetical protein
VSTKRWRRVANLHDSGPDDRHFELAFRDNGGAAIRFGAVCTECGCRLGLGWRSRIGPALAKRAQSSCGGPSRSERPTSRIFGWLSASALTLFEALRAAEGDAGRPGQNDLRGIVLLKFLGGIGRSSWDGPFGFQVVGPRTPDRPAVAGDLYAVEVDRDLQARAADVRAAGAPVCGKAPSLGMQNTRWMPGSIVRQKHANTAKPEAKSTVSEAWGAVTAA